MADISKEAKIQITERQITSVQHLIYDASIQARVAKNVDDKNMEKLAIERMAKLEKMKDEYGKIVAELKKES